MLAYEDLKGSSGRQIFFRPKRYDAADLFAGSPPKVILAAQEFKLQDISMSGLCASANQTSEPNFGEGELLPATIKQSGLTLLESKARVVRFQRHAFGSKVALNFVDGVVDFQTLLRKNAQARISRQLAMFDPHAVDIVPQAYRALCADVLRLTRSYRAIIEASTKPLPNHSPGMTTDETYALCEERIIPQWRSLWRQGNMIVGPLMENKPILAATKEYTELVLTPELNHGPVWWRSYFKPSGYPGDFEIMNYVYDWQREGRDVYSQLMHRIGLDVAECIATRMHVVRKIIADVVRSKANGAPVKVLSLGCGSAREVELFLSDPEAPQAAVDFTLIDQEENALSYAYAKSYPLTLSKKPHATVKALNVSFTDVLRGGKWLEDVGPQDLIYSVGLLDYLIDRRARSLAERLYDRLKPGGLLIIGNMNATELSNLWPMEFITDWHLFYRSEPEMLAWSADMPNRRAWTELDPTGRVRLLFVKKESG